MLFAYSKHKMFIRYKIYKYFLFCEFSFHSLMSFEAQTFLCLINFDFFVFFFCTCALGVISKKQFPNLYFLLIVL